MKRIRINALQFHAAWATAKLTKNEDRELRARETDKINQIP
jgi:hypothetical protein